MLRPQFLKLHGGPLPQAFVLYGRLFREYRGVTSVLCSRCCSVSDGSSNICTFD
jgi:hypothetical protein